MPATPPLTPFGPLDPRLVNRTTAIIDRSRNRVTINTGPWNADLFRLIGAL